MRNLYWESYHVEVEERNQRVDVRLDREENDIRDLSRTQLEIQDLRFGLNLDQELYTQIRRRIHLLERPAQSQALNATR